MWTQRCRRCVFSAQPFTSSEFPVRTLGRSAPLVPTDNPSSSFGSFKAAHLWTEDGTVLLQSVNIQDRLPRAKPPQKSQHIFSVKADILGMKVSIIMTFFSLSLSAPPPHHPFRSLRQKYISSCLFKGTKCCLASNIEHLEDASPRSQAFQNKFQIKVQLKRHFLCCVRALLSRSTILAEVLLPGHRFFSLFSLVCTWRGVGSLRKNRIPPRRK